MQQIAELGGRVSFLEDADNMHSEAEQGLGEEDNRLSQFINGIQGLISVKNACFLTITHCFVRVGSNLPFFYFLLMGGPSMISIKLLFFYFK